MSAVDDVLAGREPYRRPNFTFACEVCAMVCEVYLRPSRPRRRFCSPRCRNYVTVHERRVVVRRGPDHHAWTGDAVSREGGRARALHAFKVLPPCVACGSPKSERHHIDGNTANNSPENIEPLCHRCHARRHVGGFRGRRAS